jgi:GGDEF domain-containing protein
VVGVGVGPRFLRRNGQGGIGPAPVAAALAALLLLAFAGLNLRASTTQLRRASLSDELTGLPNRRLLADRLQQALQHAGRRGSSCAVLLIDLDRFKEVNDTLGHHYGDLLLREVAAGCGTVVRSSDTVARLGGDEFAVLLTDVDGAEARTRSPSAACSSCTSRSSSRA